MSQIGKDTPPALLHKWLSHILITCGCNASLVGCSFMFFLHTLLKPFYKLILQLFKFIFSLVLVYIVSLSLSISSCRFSKFFCATAHPTGERMFPDTEKWHHFGAFEDTLLLNDSTSLGDLVENTSSSSGPFDGLLLLRLPWQCFPLLIVELTRPLIIVELTRQELKPNQML